MFTGDQNEVHRYSHQRSDVWYMLIPEEFKNAPRRVNAQSPFHPRSRGLTLSIYPDTSTSFIRASVHPMYSPI